MADGVSKLRGRKAADRVGVEKADLGEAMRGRAFLGESAGERRGGRGRLVGVVGFGDTKAT